MKIPIYQVDAFTDQLFSGNPAAVCILQKWLESNHMQSIATENNLAETAFICKVNEYFEIRWFTPEAEVDLCGHATLAAAHVLFEHLNFSEGVLKFKSLKFGILGVSKSDNGLQLDFPQDEVEAIDCPAILLNAFEFKPKACYKGKTDYLFIFENQSQIEQASPNLDLISQAGNRGIIISAPGDEVDFVSRFFAPQIGIPEDPVTGSAHTTLTPYWAKKLNKEKLRARQLSKRGGKLFCEMKGNRVLISGQAVTYLIGEIII